MPALLAVGQTPRVIATIRSLFTARLLWLLIDLPFAAWLMVRLRATWAFDRKPARRPWPQAIAAAVVLGAGGFALSAPHVLSGAELDRVSTVDLARYHDDSVNWRVVEGYGTTIAAAVASGSWFRVGWRRVV